MAFHYAAGFSTSRVSVHRPQTGPSTPTTQRCTAITCDGFRLFPVRSPLLGESRLISSPPGTEMVQFPGFPFRILWIQTRMMDIQSIGLPHSAIRGSRDVCSSPRLFAAYHGLLRTAAPRHPPWTLSRLTISSSALQSGPRRSSVGPRASPLRPVPGDPRRPPKSARNSCPPAADRAPLAPPRLSGSGSARSSSSSPFPCVVKEPRGPRRDAAARPSYPRTFVRAEPPFGGPG